MKPNMLFVDDEQLVLNGLRRMLRNHRHDWDISFAQSGKEALSLFKQKSYDVVVSDMRMPEIPGSVLLTEIADRHPTCTRLILSGHAEISMILDTVMPAHQFHAKPCDMVALSNCLKSIRNTFSFDVEPEIRAHLNGLQYIYSCPLALDELNNHLEQESPDPVKTLRILSTDIALTAQVLRLVNSAFFSTARQTLDLQQAISIIGHDLFKRLLSETNLFRAPENNEQQEIVKVINRSAQELVDSIDKVADDEKYNGECVRKAKVAALMSYVGSLACLSTAFDNKPHPDVLTSLLLTIWGFDQEIIKTITQEYCVNSEKLEDVSELLHWARRNT